jgi:hypothetical protein
MSNTTCTYNPGIIPELLSLAADGSYIIPAGDTILGCRIDPAANLAAFKIGTTNGGEEIIAAMAITSAAGESIQPLNIYAKVATTVYFGGITSLTEIRLYKLRS